MNAIIDRPARHLIDTSEYLRMAEAGVFAPDARLELIDGEILEMAPIGSPHSGLVNRLNMLFGHRAYGRAVVSVQNPLVANDRSVPQPDLVLLKPRADMYSDSHPRPQDSLLVIEVADSSIDFDARVKAPLYMKAGILECWVIDVNRSVVHVFQADRTFIASAGDTIAPLGLPDIPVSLDELFSVPRRS